MTLEMTNYTEDLVINRLLRAEAYTPPPNVFLALFSTSTDDDGSGTEAAGGSYSRQAVTLSAASGGATASTNTITYVNMPAGSWTNAALFDASSGGNMLWHGPLPSPRITSGGQTIQIGVGDIVIGLTSTSAATEYFRNALIDHLLRGQSFVPPTTVYQSLHTAPTTTSGGGTEMSGGGYARAAVTLTLAVDGETSNDDTVTLPVGTGTVTHGALFDASSGGNMLLQAELVSPVVTTSGDYVEFALGDISYSVT